MRVAFISDHASPLAALGGVDAGGQNVYVAEAARHLAGLGHEVDVFTRRDRSGAPECVDWIPGVRVIHVPAGPEGPLAKEDLWDHMPEFTDHVSARVAGGGYDIVHAHFWMSGAVALELKRRHGTPFVITFHALGKVRRRHLGPDDRFPDTRFTVEDAIVRDADRLIAECPQDEQDLIQLYEADPGRISMVACGVSPEEFHPIDQRLARSRLGIEPGDHVVLSLGRLVPRKGVDTAIRAMARLRAEHGLESRLLVVGGESGEPDPAVTPEIGRLQGVAREEGVEGLVTFVGHRDRESLKYYYGAADVFVTTPWYEPFGITPLESMACGTPVVGSNVGGIKFSVRDGETGFLVPPRDPGAVAGRIAELRRNPKVAAMLSAQGVRRARDLFGWDGVAESLAAVYGEVVDHRHRGSWDVEVETVNGAFTDLVELLIRSRAVISHSLAGAAAELADTIVNGGKVLVAGNGGSAAESQHFAAELVGRFRHPGRRGLPVIALTADTAVLTAWSNDVSYDDVFARQVEALAVPGDLVVGLTTSGNSPNLVRAFEEARQRRVRTLAVVGGDGGRLRGIADTTIIVPSADTQRIQEVQGLMVHVLCELIEQRVVRIEGTGLTSVPSNGGRPPAPAHAVTELSSGARRGG
jgi:D-inositol-3-phosphate glycosyltransferase